MDHTYMSQSLSSLVIETKSDYDKIFFDYSTIPECQYIISDPIDIKSEQFVSLKDSIGMDVEEHILEGMLCAICRGVSSLRINPPKSQHPLTPTPILHSFTFILLRWDRERNLGS